MGDDFWVPVDGIDAAPAGEAHRAGCLPLRGRTSGQVHWVFRSSRAVVHTASPTRGAVVGREMMDGHRPAVWISDRDTARPGHAVAHQTCLAHLACDVAYGVETSADPVAWRLQL